MNNYYPLTIGLLCSMCLRENHSFLMDLYDSDFIPKEYQIKDKINTINYCTNFYYRIVFLKENDDNHKLYEEITGNGFYKPENDKFYENNFLTLYNTLIKNYNIT